MNNYLYHHGVKGMKWGVRRFQKKDGTLTPAGRKRYADGENSKGPSDNDGNSKKGLTDKQKRAIKIGAAAVTTGLVVYGGYKLHQSGKLDSLIESGKSQCAKTGLKVNGLQLDSVTNKFKYLNHKETVEEAISKVNSTGQRNNCYNCVAATIGRLCGLDVVAKGDTQGGKGLNFDDLCKAFKLNPDNETEVRRLMKPSVDKVSNLIGRKYKEGDVGAIAVSLNDKYKKMAGISGSAGHTLNWTVRNGKVEFMDGQVNISGDRLSNFLNNYLDSGKEVSIARFANVNDDPSSIIDILEGFVN